MDQDMRDMHEETIELTAVAEKLRDEADGYRSLATYAEGKWAEAVNENVVLHREVERLRALLVDADPRWMRDADERSCDIRHERESLPAYLTDDEYNAKCGRLDRARERLERLTRAEPAFGPASLCEVDRG